MANYTSNWDYSNKHIDSNISKDNFLSAARSILYAAPYKSGSAATSAYNSIGVVQGYQWGENRNVDMVFELGSDLPYLVPGRTVGSISLSRILVFGQDLTNLIYYGGKMDSGDVIIKSLKEINNPINIMLANYSNNGTKVYSRVFSGAWINSRSESIQAGQVLLSENVNIMYEDIIGATVTL